MAQGVLGSKEALVRKFHISYRLAARIGSLFAKKVRVTEAVLEQATPDTPLEKVLLHNQVLNRADNLSPEVLTAAISELAPGLDLALTVILDEEGRTIALEEEVLAEEAWSEAARRQTALAPQTFTTPLLAADLIDLDQIFEKAAPGEIEDLKFTIVTSADPREKIASIRKLVLLSGGDPRVAGILLSALRDDAPEVRVEAVRALTAYGLSTEVMEAAKAVTLGTPEQKALAVQRMGRLVRGVPEQQRSILLTLLASALQNEPAPELKEAVITSFEEALAAVSSVPGYIGELCRLLIEQLQLCPAELAPCTERLLGKLGEASPDTTAPILWDEQTKSAPGIVRTVLLMTLGGLHLSEELRPKVAEAIAQDIARRPNPDTASTRLANRVNRFGGTAARALIRCFPSATSSQKVFMVELLDNLCSRPDAGESLHVQVAGFVRDIFRISDRQVRTAALHARVCRSPHLPDSLKVELTQEFLTNVHVFGNPKIRETIYTVVARMGAPAIDPLRDLLENSLRRIEREAACIVLGRLLAGLMDWDEQTGQKARDIVLVSQDLLNGVFPAKGALAVALGQMCSGRIIEAADVERAYLELRRNLEGSEHPYHVLEGLGWLASGANTSFGLRLNTVEIFMNLLEGEMPEVQSEVGGSADEPVFALGKEVTAYTEMIPIALEALRRICTAERTSDALRHRIVGLVLKKWRQTRGWDVLWGPTNLTLMLEVMRDIGKDPAMPDAITIEIVEGLAEEMEHLPVVNTIADICWEATSSEIGRLAGAVAERLVSRRITRGNYTEGQREAILLALGRLAGNQYFRTAGGEDTATVRSRIVELLFDGLKDGLSCVRSPLARLQELPELDGRLRSEIAKRLAKTGGAP